MIKLINKITCAIFGHNIIGPFYHVEFTGTSLEPMDGFKYCCSTCSKMWDYHYFN